jgi:hypothetical protein
MMMRLVAFDLSALGERARLRLAWPGFFLRMKFARNLITGGVNLAAFG